MFYLNKITFNFIVMFLNNTIQSGFEISFKNVKIVEIHESLCEIGDYSFNTQNLKFFKLTTVNSIGLKFDI